MAFKKSTGKAKLGNKPSGNRPKFVYRGRGIDAVRKRATKQGGSFDNIFLPNVDVLRVPEGDHTVRILPPTWNGAGHYGYQIWQHRLERGTYLCLDRMLHKPCPACKLVLRMKARQEEDEAKQIQAKEAYICYAIDRKDTKSKAPKLWLMGWTLDRDLAAQTEDKKRGEVLLIDDPWAGFDVMFRRIGKGPMDTKYFGWQIDREPTPIFEDKEDTEEVLDFIMKNPVDEQLLYKTPAEMEAIVAGTSEEPDEDSDDADAESEDEGREAKSEMRKGGKNKDKRRAADADPDDDDDDSGNDENTKDSAYGEDDDPDADPDADPDDPDADPDDDPDADPDDADADPDADPDDDPDADPDDDPDDDDRKPAARKPKREPERERVSAKSTRNGRERVERVERVERKPRAGQERERTARKPERSERRPARR